MRQDVVHPASKNNETGRFLALEQVESVKDAFSSLTDGNLNSVLNVRFHSPMRELGRSTGS